MQSEILVLAQLFARFGGAVIGLITIAVALICLAQLRRELGTAYGSRARRCKLHDAAVVIFTSGLIVSVCLVAFVWSF